MGEPARSRVSPSTDEALPLGQVWSRWWPLAASWLLMGVELPAVTAVLARFPDPAVNLAAYGGLVFPLCLLIEAPVIMLLATSTALARDWPSYRALRAFMNVLGGGLTLVHVLLAFTPLWDLVVGRLLGAPPETVEPARLAMRIMTPWTWAIGCRRFQQGVLIRFGHSRAVGVGTVVRLTTGALLLGAGLLHGGLNGIVVGAGATATAVVMEMLYVAWRIRPVLRKQLPKDAEEGWHVGWPKLVAFHTPLALTSLIHLAGLPLGSAAMGRMPASLASLAAWPVVNGLTFLVRSVGLAYTEVVVVLSEKPRAYATLWRFAWLLGLATGLGLATVAATPLRELWLEGVAGLTPDLSALAATALWLAILHPWLAALQSFYQGMLVSSHRTRAVTEAVALGLAAAVTLLAAGVLSGRVTGLYVAVPAMVIGSSTQVLWLRWRNRRPAES